MKYDLLGEKIREARKAKGYTLEQLAEILDVSTTFIGQIERAKGIPSLDTLVKIANALDISTDSLLFGELNARAADDHFMKRISELTSDFTTKEKAILLKNIENFCELKHLYVPFFAKNEKE